MTMLRWANGAIVTTTGKVGNDRFVPITSEAVDAALIFGRDRLGGTLTP